MKISDLLDMCREVDRRLPPSPWEADIDDPDTNPDFTGKFSHPSGLVSTTLDATTCLYNEPKVASDVAMMRNLFHDLLKVIG